MKLVHCAILESLLDNCSSEIEKNRNPTLKGRLHNLVGSYIKALIIAKNDFCFQKIKLNCTLKKKNTKTLNFVSTYDQ